MEIFAALMMGLAGSFHCIGMCGPIAVALPLGQSKWPLKALGALSYNLGRTVTYGLFGVVFGFVGEGLNLAGLQRWVSIVMGSIMILSVVFPSMANALNTGNGIFSFMNKVKMGLQNLFKHGNRRSLFFIGLLNGLLPCGLVYMAIAGAIATASLSGSIMFMVLFGLGTIPMLFFVSMAGSLAGGKFRTFFNKAIPYIVVLVGLLFILRGLELGIKYISPPANKLVVPVEMGGGM